MSKVNSLFINLLSLCFLLFSEEIASHPNICLGVMTGYYSSVLIFLSIIFIYFLNETRGTFLSNEDLEEFYDLEENLTTTFETFIQEQKHILEVIKKRSEDQKRWQPKMDNSDEYLNNPLNVHALLKRLVYDWPLTLALLGGSVLTEEEEELIGLPPIEEYQAAVHGIARLQQVYHYNIQEVVTGSAFLNTDNTSVLTVEDCFAVGKDFYDNHHFPIAILWFNEVLTQASNQRGAGESVHINISRQQSSPLVPLENIYEYLALATCFTGDQKQSDKYFKKLYEFLDFKPSQNLIKDHLLAVNESCTKIIDYETLKPMNEDTELSANYSTLCRAEARPVTSRHLSCSLVHWAEPFWRLQPIRVEDLHRDPDIYMTYDVISPAERKSIMEEMTDKVLYWNILHMRGLVSEIWQPLPANYSLTESLIRRTERISGATVHNSRGQTRLAYFPPGAEYVVNMDLDSKATNLGKNLLGSTTFFLQEPQVGGLVVFPRLGLSVSPVVGAALTWFGVDREGRVDERIAYGSCPVVQGFKTSKK